jgi:hypothetical protein
MKHAWNFLGISPECIIHIVPNKESATGRKSGAATVCVHVHGASKRIMKGGHKDGKKNVRKK